MIYVIQYVVKKIYIYIPKRDLFTYRLYERKFSETNLVEFSVLV